MDKSKTIEAAFGAEQRPPEVGVHVLSEHVYCPRAALLALEAGQDGGQDEPELGPRLDGWIDYDAHRFAEEIRTAWDDLRLWLTLMAPAALGVLLLWRMISPLAGIIVALPAFYLAGRIWDTSMRIIDLVRERALLEAAPQSDVDAAPSGMTEVNWWTLRKAGFDCLKPVDAYRNPGRRLSGKPWRILIKGTTLRVPVVRKHRGGRSWGRQHLVRLAAYCHLIEACEGADAPFGVLMFAGSYDCLIFPNTPEAKRMFETALEDAREFVRVYEEGKYLPAAPIDNRCSGCHLGKPRLFREGSATFLRGIPIAAFQTRAIDGQIYHSHCGDRFNWTPPHEKAVELQIVG